MQAKVGQRLVIRSHHLGEPVKDGKIVEIRDPNGAPPYMVKWSEDGRVGLFFPGADAYVDQGADGESTTNGA
jgi:hypothetical protein